MSDEAVDVAKWIVENMPNHTQSYTVARALLSREAEIQKLLEHPIFVFLEGAAPYDGVWFGDRHPTEKGAFWWRKHLRAALKTAGQPSADGGGGGEVSLAAKMRYRTVLHQAREHVERLRDELRVAQEALAEIERSRDARIAYYDALYEAQS